MKSNFAKSLALVLAHEGGYVNHPRDPGGETNKGVTKAVYDDYRRSRNRPTQSVRHITDHEVAEIYKKRYWDLCKCDQLPAGVDYAVFDYAVNSGPGRSAKELQRVVGASVDGLIGPATIDAVCRQAEIDEEGIIRDLCDRRMRFLRSLKTFKTFGKGWTRRVVGNREGAQESDHGVLDIAIMMARQDLTYGDIEQLKTTTPIGEGEGEPVETPLVKAVESDQAVTKTKSGVGQIIAATGVTGQVVMGAADKVSPRIDDTPIGMIAFAVFIMLIIAGVGLTLWSLKKKIDEKDGANEVKMSYSASSVAASRT